ncbi:SPFH domain-containing protein [Streptomyces sp. NPDC096339]|uniref:SPFH domain-containing protein n=1 Tax=Streptomyces sp. NPDC096339 TaxID=3366086 RepID=UPI00381ED95F
MSREPKTTGVPGGAVEGGRRNDAPAPAGEGAAAEGAAVEGVDCGRIPTALTTSRGVVVRLYRDPVVLAPLFRDEQPARADGHAPAPLDRTPSDAPRTSPTPTPGATAARGRVLPAVLDPEIVERPARVCSGWWALAAALLAAGGGAALARYAEFRLGTTPAEVWPLAALACCAAVAVAALGGLRRGRSGHAWALTLFGRYRGTIRRTGLIWSNPLPRHARVDVRLRHWRSEPLSVVDAEGTALRSVVLVVWRVKDTARALLAVDDHASYLRGQVEAATARVLSRMPADSFRPPDGDGGAGPQTLRDTEAVGEELTRLLAAECRSVGVEVFSARPLRVEYAPEVAAAMQRRRIAAIDARHRDSVLTSVIDAVDDTVHRMSDRGLVSLDDYERKALVKDLTVAFYTARGPAADAR